MTEPKLKLGVNVDHVATLRQARGTDYPSVVDAALACEAAGAHGITIHLREDRRHIQDADVYAVREQIQTRLNLEMANHPAIVEIALEVRPDEVCLVPEKRAELTTEGGLDVAGNLNALLDPVRRMREAGIVVSMFIDPDPAQIQASATLGAPCIELHTGAFCDLPTDQRGPELERLVAGARQAHALGLQVNAGHGLNLDNLAGIFDVPFMHTLNIGHSIVSHAVMVGMEAAVTSMLDAMVPYTGERG
ncbi:MAG: pyridoxine 5'-phosphate synthase [Verrucomicrobia bacterium]|jgi:pyridoxine 5-phosphate synthase|nr:pyridoxine 5'-phosphate synthase [Verrucomicrobiota bacterium]MBT7066975.1 pyridoxine 5'-phosphate synthase [Verrucomicrobiota bacterium]MBT7699994.1 pyridoxine 5'-phosphate synthase [Verrucomicrobiota bacterium]